MKKIFCLLSVCWFQALQAWGNPIILEAGRSITVSSEMLAEGNNSIKITCEPQVGYLNLPRCYMKSRDNDGRVPYLVFLKNTFSKNTILYSGSWEDAVQKLRELKNSGICH